MVVFNRRMKFVNVYDQCTRDTFTYVHGPSSSHKPTIMQLEEL